MTEEAETGDASSDLQKASKRDRFRGALSRTKSKFKKQDDKDQKGDFKLSDDVNDFLQAGRPSTSDSITQGLGTFPRQQEYGHKQEVYKSRDVLNGPSQAGRPPTADSLPPHPSPRRLAVPRIDVSKSQRWPGQQPVGPADIGDFLRPTQQIRSHSHGPMARRKDRPRGLSVSFLETPPIIIGEGGDEADMPPSEISRQLRIRTRSASPIPPRSSGSDTAGSVSTVRRKAVPGQEDRSTQSEVAGFARQRLARAPTGFAETTPVARSATDMEFDMTMQPGVTPVTSAGGISPSYDTEPLNNNVTTSKPGWTTFEPSQHVAPTTKPAVRDGSDVGRSFEPLAQNEPETDHSLRLVTHHDSKAGHFLKPSLAADDLRLQFEEGRALRQGHYRGLSNTSIITGELPEQPDHSSLQQLSLGDTGQPANQPKDIFSPTRPDTGKEEQRPASGWI